LVLYAPASAVDAVDGSVSVLCSPGSGSQFPLGSTRVGCTASDRSGNVGLAFFTVRVFDTTPPVVTAPASVVVDAESPNGTSASNAAIASFLAGGVATDVVDPAPQITTDAPDLFPVGTTTVVFTASDASGNRATATSAVTVPAYATGGSAGSVLWRGNYETGDFSQWAEPQSACTGNGYSVTDVGNSCASVVSSPVRQGGRAGRFQIGPHTAAAPSAERAEVYAGVAETGGYEGQEWYYAWSTMFPAAGNPLGFWPDFANWNVFTDFHNPGSCNSNVQLGINATGALPFLYFEDDNFPTGNCSDPSSMLYKNLGTLQFDHWYDFVLHVKWSSDPGVGYVELWVDGVKVVPLTNGQTMADVSSASVYWKQGFYRSAFGGLNTAYQDGALRGDTLAAVQG
jgi:hypothetical protein